MIIRHVKIRSSSLLLLALPSLSFLASLLHLLPSKSSSPVGLEPLCGLVELLLGLVLFSLLFINDGLESFAFSLFFEPFIPLFFDLSQILRGIFVLLLHDVFLLVLILHVGIVGLQCLRVTFISQLILVSQVFFFSGMLFFSVFKLLVKLADTRLQLGHSLLVSLSCIGLDCLTLLHEFLLTLCSVRPEL